MTITRFASLLLLSLCGSLAMAQTNSNQERVERYTVLISGANVGHLDASIDGREVSIDFDYKNNGRGPTLKERIALSEAGLPTSWQIERNRSADAARSEPVVRSSVRLIALPSPSRPAPRDRAGPGAAPSAGGSG